MTSHNRALYSEKDSDDLLAPTFVNKKFWEDGDRWGQKRIG
jgi:hypothetical protein